MDNNKDETVAMHRAGSTDPDELDSLISKAWSAAVEDTADRIRIEAILGLSDEELRQSPPPFRAEVSDSGLTGAEIVIVFASAFVVAYAKKLGTATGTAAADLTTQQARKLWSILKDRIFYSEPEALGPELNESD